MCPNIATSNNGRTMKRCAKHWRSNSKKFCYFIYCWWIAQVAHCLCKGCQWYPDKTLPTSNIPTDANQDPLNTINKFQKLYLCYVGWNQWLMNPYFTDVYWIHGVTTKNHWYDSWFFPMFSVRPDVLSLKYWTWASAFSPHFNSVTIWNIQSCSTYTCGDFWQRPPH